MDEGRAVVVDGWGAVADEAVAQLRRVGVLVRSGAQAVDAAELELAAGGHPPALLVLVADGDPPPWADAPSMLAPWHGAGVPHLPVLAAGTGVVVGPLVVPGASACLACVCAGASADPPGGDAASAQVAPGTAVLAAAVVTVTALAVRRGDVSVAGISTEIGHGGTTVLHRVWTSRAGCRCASVRMAG